jgi:tetratricopeptide (TPR) repeat protein
MSQNDEKSSDMMCCASCGVAAVDDVKLKDCSGGCDLVKYCSDACQDNHSKQHEEACKKRLAEFRDRDLFTMPDGTHWGECPICCLPLPIDEEKSSLKSCCSKLICDGCCYASQMRELNEGLERRCVFCREPLPKSEEEADKNRIERVKKNCPAAMNYMGSKHYEERDYETAFEYWSKAAELGDANGHYNLSCLYDTGLGVEKDTEKEIYHLEQAAIEGHPNARHNLGCEEFDNGRYERARKHFIIAANLGHNHSLQCLKDLYALGHASKEDYANALRAYQAALEETKSAEREEAEADYKARGVHVY